MAKLIVKSAKFGIVVKELVLPITRTGRLFFEISPEPYLRQTGGKNDTTVSIWAGLLTRL